MSNIDDWSRQHNEMQRIHRTRKWYCCEECDEEGPCVINMSPRWTGLYGGKYEAPDNCLANPDGDYCGSAEWKEVSEETALEMVRNANEKCRLTRILAETSRVETK